MAHAPQARRPTQVAIGSHIRPGDLVLRDGGFVEVVRVRRAQGRKPARGENLHLVANDETIMKINSLDGIRIRARIPHGGSPA